MKCPPITSVPAAVHLAVAITLGSSPGARAHDPMPHDAQSAPFRVSILAPDGSELGDFTATGEDMHIDQVKMGPDGNVWLTRADNSHGSGIPNPNDMVAVFTLEGIEIDTITGGGMRHPLSVGWDRAGSIYVNGEDLFFATDVYKYDVDGGYVTKFHTAGWNLIDDYNDIVVAAGDRIYVSSWHGTGNDDQMTEFNIAGQTLNTFSPTGPGYFHRDAALSPSPTVWVRTPRNGPGDDLVREFSLDGSQINLFSTTAAVPGSNMCGLEMPADASIYVLNREDHVLYELDTNGNVLDTTLLQGLTSWITDFTFGPGGVILVANQAPPTSMVAEAAPGAAGTWLVAAPNPFRVRVELRFATAAGEPVGIGIYDVAGRLVRSYAPGARAGLVAWDGRDAAGGRAPAGIYFARLAAGPEHRTARILLVR